MSPAIKAKKKAYVSTIAKLFHKQAAITAAALVRQRFAKCGVAYDSRWHECVETTEERASLLGDRTEEPASGNEIDVLVLVGRVDGK